MDMGIREGINIGEMDALIINQLTNKNYFL